MVRNTRRAVLGFEKGTKTTDQPLRLLFAAFLAGFAFHLPEKLVAAVCTSRPRAAGLGWTLRGAEFARKRVNDEDF